MRGLATRMVTAMRISAIWVVSRVIAVILLFACRDRRVSWQGRVLILALRGYRVWSTHQAQDLMTQRHAQDTFGKRLPIAAGVWIEALTIAECTAEWAIPAGAPQDHAVLYLHGGAYTTGSRVSHRALVTRIARAAGVRVLSLEYRLAPEHPFPAALDDAVAAYRWLLAQGFAPSHLMVAGDSAGGGLAVATLVALRDQGTGLPAGAALLSPWTDLSDPAGTWERNAPQDLLLTPESLHAAARDYLGDRSRTLPLASPIYADLHALPPLLIQVGGAELLREDTLTFAARAVAAGVDARLEIWSGMFHAWQMMAAYLPEGEHAITQVGAFIGERLGGAPSVGDHGCATGKLGH